MEATTAFAVVSSLQMQHQHHPHVHQHNNQSSQEVSNAFELDSNGEIVKPEMLIADWINMTYKQSFLFIRIYK